MEQKIQNLIAYGQGIFHNENGKELYERYQEDILGVTPKDIFSMQKEQLKKGMSQENLLSFVDKLMNIFHKSLLEYQWDKPEKGSFLDSLMEENRMLEQKMIEMQQVFKQQEFSRDRQEILAFLEELSYYQIHLQKLENLLFPSLEKKDERYLGTSVMWTLHDLIRKRLKTLLAEFSKDTLNTEELNRQIGGLYIDLNGLIMKQNLILFPCGREELTDEELDSLLDQSFDYGFVYIQEPPRPELSAGNKGIQELGGTIDLGTGVLNLQQLIGLLSALPVDLTFVDANDKVAFFSRPEERIFPRSLAVIGRDVRNCHPAESVHVVEKIVQDFKDGTKDRESFWIRMRGMYLLIQYFAVKSQTGEYLGTLEVSQEISQIQALQGEKRLLD